VWGEGSGVKGVWGEGYKGSGVGCRVCGVCVVRGVGCRVCGVCVVRGVGKKYV
jgi:hypothetical protein